MSEHDPLRIWSRAATIYLLSKAGRTGLSPAEAIDALEDFTEADYAKVADLLDSGIIDDAVTSQTRNVR